MLEGSNQSPIPVLSSRSIPFSPKFRELTVGTGGDRQPIGVKNDGRENGEEEQGQNELSPHHLRQPLILRLGKCLQETTTSGPTLPSASHRAKRVQEAEIPSEREVVAPVRESSSETAFARRKPTAGFSFRTTSLRSENGALTCSSTPFRIKKKNI